MSYVLGIDLGTSSLKGLLMNKSGKIVAEASSDYPLISDKPGYSEQDPEHWYQAFLEVVEVLSENVTDFKSGLEAIGFSGQMHSLVLLDENEEVLRPAILWNDVRNTKQSNEIMERHGTLMLDLTRNRSLEGFTLPKLLWVKEHEPEIYEKIETIMMPKDYLRFRITGQKNAEYSDAAGTMLLDVEKREWSKAICDAFDVPMGWLPPLVESYDNVGGITDKLNLKLNFTNEIKVVAGGADNACAALGSGLISDDVAMASIGTSGVFLSIDHRIEDYKGNLHFFNSCINSYYAMGVTLSAGNSLNWIKNIVNEDSSFDEFLSGIDGIPNGTDGLLFTPYIMGERTPFFDSKIRGSFIGLDIQHSKKHLVRAVMEGITYSLNDSKRIMEKEKNKKFKRIISVGGGAKNKVWLQMQADVFDAEIVALSSEQGPGLGAAMLAALGAGWYQNPQECVDACVSYKTSVQPNTEAVKTYRDYYDVYTKVYDATSSLSHLLVEKRTFK